jgi:hypothetical protein
MFQGLAYPLFYVFLGSYLATRSASFNVSTYETWRNYALVNISSIPVNFPFLAFSSTLTKHRDQC